jgi:hypothetical protein
MHKIALAVAVAVTVAGPALAQHDRKTELVNQLIQLTRVNDTGFEALVLFLMTDASGPDLEEAKRLIEELRHDGRIQSEVTKVTSKVLSERLTEKQLKSLVSFFKSDAGKAYSDAVVALTKERPERLVNVLVPPQAAKRSHEQWTMADMRTAATAAEAYATDFNKYPDAKTIEELKPILMPTYIRTLPLTDAWGTVYAYIVSADKQHYRFVSAGPDKKFDPTSLQIGVKPAKSDDLVFEDGLFVQAPSGVTEAK